MLFFEQLFVVFLNDMVDRFHLVGEFDPKFINMFLIRIRIRVKRLGFGQVFILLDFLQTFLVDFFSVYFINNLGSRQDFRLHFLQRGTLSLKPRMFADLSNTWAVFHILRKHLFNQIFELSTWMCHLLKYFPVALFIVL